MTDFKNTSLLKIRPALLYWYRTSRRDLPWRRTKAPYPVWISEVMLQQTRIETVIPYYHRFLDAFPDIQHLADADLQMVLKQWEGLGYYSRARNLHLAAKIICSDYDSEFPRTREQLTRLPGIGDYISAAIASICFQEKIPVVDGNVKRVLTRLFADKAAVNDISKKKHFTRLAGELLDTGHPGDFNQAVMELGQRICIPRAPLCDTCPTNHCCRALQRNEVLEFPRKQPVKKIPTLRKIYLIIQKEEKLLIMRRVPRGFLGGLWEFPGFEIIHPRLPDADLTQATENLLGLQVGRIRKIGSVRHGYTHFKVVADVYHARFQAGRITGSKWAGYHWVLPQERYLYPMHKLIHKMFPLIQE